MALDKNDGTFSPSIEGVISGKTSQVSGMNGLLNDLIGNDNYLNGKKLDKGSYTGTAEDLSNDIKSRLSYVDNIEELKKATKYKVGDIVDVLGYYSAGDGGGHQRKLEKANDGRGIEGVGGLWWNVVGNSFGVNEYDVKNLYEFHKKYNIFNKNFSKNSDPWGKFTSINIIGDSISHGANCPEMDRQSYASIIKYAILNSFNSKNYGYETFLSEISNVYGTYKGMHVVEKSGNWQNWEINLGEYLGQYYLQSDVQGDYLLVKPKLQTGKFFIAYSGNLNGGSFDVLVDGELKHTQQVERVDYKALITIEIGNGREIKIVNKENKQLNVSGIFYFDNLNDVIVNNFSRSGGQLTKISDSAMDFQISENLNIVALGHNDNGTLADINTFKQKLELIKTKTIQKGGNLVYVDFIYDEDSNVYKKAIKDMCNSGNFMYINMYEELNKKIEGIVQDGSHPSVYGSSIIAKIIMDKINLIPNINYLDYGKKVIPNPLAEFSQFPARIKCCENVVMFEMYVKNVFSNNDIIATIPTEVAPKIGTIDTMTNHSYSNGELNFIGYQIDSDGNVKIRTNMNDKAQFNTAFPELKINSTWIL